MAAKNHPSKGSTIKVEPIKDVKDIRSIKRLLKDQPRNLCIFTLGINTNLRASDLLKITVGQVRHLQPGDHFALREKKTSKDKNITINKTVHETVQALLATMPDAADNQLLFQSRKAQTRKPIMKDGNVVGQPQTGELSVPYLNGLVKSWCAEINLKGNYGSHTLRKTFGYQHRVQFNTDLPTLMHMFNHSSQKQTLDYLCIQPEEIKDAYLREI